MIQTKFILEDGKQKKRWEKKWKKANQLTISDKSENK